MCAARLRRVASYLELRLLSERPYVTYVVAVTLVNAGYFVPYFHLVAHARQAGFSQYQAAFVMSAAGVSDIFGRVVSGWLSDLRLLRLIHVLSLWVTLTGLFIILLPVSSLNGSYPALMATSVLYGLCSGAMTSVVFAVVPDIVGAERTMGALGLLMLIESVAGLLGTPLSGRSPAWVASGKPPNRAVERSGGHRCRGDVVFVLFLVELQPTEEPPSAW